MVEKKPWWEADFVQSAARGSDRIVEASKKVPVLGPIVRGFDQGGQSVNRGDWAGAARNYGSAFGGLALAGLGGSALKLAGRGAIAGVGALRAGAGARGAGIAAGQAGRGALSSGLTGRQALGLSVGGGILAGLAPGQQSAVPSLTLDAASSTESQMPSPTAPTTLTQPTAPTFSDAIRGLTTGQQEYFESLVSGEEQGMRRRLSNLQRQEEQARFETGQRVRSSRAMGAGSAADMRAATAGRGLMSSPASFEVGTEYLAGQSQLEQAQARGQLDRLLQESARGQADERAQFEQFMQNVRRQRLSQQQGNEQEFMNRLIQSQQMYFR